MNIKILILFLFLNNFYLCSLSQYGKLLYITKSKNRINPKNLKNPNRKKLFNKNYFQKLQKDRLENQIKGRNQKFKIDNVNENSLTLKISKNIKRIKKFKRNLNENNDEQIENQEKNSSPTDTNQETELQEHHEEEEENEHEHHEEEVENEHEHHEGEEYDHEHHEEEEQIGLKDLENEKIQAAIEMVEFKMTEVNELIKECINNIFTENPLAEKDEVLTECSGVVYQILFRNYKEAIIRVKDIFFELIRNKTGDLDEEYDDEVSYFLDIMDQFIEMDYHVKDSLEVAKETIQYYVSPGFFDSLLEFSGPELDALDDLLTKLKESRKSVQELIDEKMIEREEYFNNLEHDVHQIQDGEEMAHDEQDSYNDMDEDIKKFKIKK